MAQILRQADVTVIRMDREYDALDVERHRQITQLLLEQAMAADPPRLLLDMSETSYIGSSFIELLFRVWKRLQQRQGEMAMCGLSPFCMEVLTATRLDKLWPLYTDCNAALAGLGGEATG